MFDACFEQFSILKNNFQLWFLEEKKQTQHGVNVQKVINIHAKLHEANVIKKQETERLLQFNDALKLQKKTNNIKIS